MQQEQKNFLQGLLNLILIEQFPVIYDKVPPKLYNLVDDARDFKRAEQYDASIRNYISAIKQSDCLYTELGRMMAKTLCAMNEYEIAIKTLFLCAKIKWEDNVVSPSSKLFNFMNNIKMPTACANDFYLLRDAVKSCANGNINQIFERTKAVSGNENYKFLKTTEQITMECKKICSIFKF